MKTRIGLAILLLALVTVEAPAEPAPAKNKTSNLQIEMVEIPAGRFQIGSPPPVYGSMQFMTLGYSDERVGELLIAGALE